VETGALDRRRDRAIPRAARNVIGGKLGGHFPSVVWQTCSGSQININLNAAIANPANVALAGEPGSKKARSPERSCRHQPVVERFVSDRDTHRRRPAHRARPGIERSASRAACKGTAVRENREDRPHVHPERNTADARSGIFR
jgi:hypothetical protein